MLYRRRPTFIEFFAMALIVSLLAAVWITQQTASASRSADNVRKQDVNTLYYYLEKVYYPTHQGYPTEISPTTVAGLDQEAFIDPSGKRVNEKDSDYLYEPSGCQNGVCHSFKLTATLGKEAPFIKDSSPRPLN